MPLVPPERLRLSCRPEQLDVTRSDQLPVLNTIIGQDRAVRALEFGLEIQSKGFNIYVAGFTGTGKHTTVKAFLESIAATRETPSDWCYVNNFRDTYRPKYIRMAPGQGREFAQDMKDLIAAARRDIARAFESEEYNQQRNETLEALNRQRIELLEAMGKRAQEEGFALQGTPVGFFIIPVIDGKPVREHEFLNLPDELKQSITQKREKLEAELESTVRQLQNLERAAAEATGKLERMVAEFCAGHLILKLKKKYASNPGIVAYLDEVLEDILDNIPLFRDGQAQHGIPPWLAGNAFRRYEVNVLVDNSDLKGAPVVIELNPLFNRLVGRIEREAHFGTLVTDFSMIKPGALHRANGGFLVLPVEELLRNPFSWDVLKRSLRDGQVTVEEISEQFGLSTRTIQPMPIPLDVKVILLGNPFIYRLLFAYDPEFSELFKVKAEFGHWMERTPENEQQYAAFAATLCTKEQLRHLDAQALSVLIEYGSRLAGDQQKLSTYFADIADVIREADCYAGRDGSEYIGVTHIKAAVRERRLRVSLIEEQLQENMERGFLRIDTSGSAVGQVNGLSVIDLGDIAFARPVRISATAAPGSGGLIDIEREARLGGRLHTKGVMILGGYLSAVFGQVRPLNLTARLVFEQSYSEVDGDSASSAELYALLSALSGLPVRQDLAVTGAINQKGEVLAVGGINEKIEGFFDLCKSRGLTGTQGVIIPESNILNLMLKDEVIEAVKEGKFAVWAISTVNEGVELLFGREAGVPDENGEFPEGSVYQLVVQRLAEFAERSKGGKGDGPSPQEAKDTCGDCSCE